MLSVVVEVKVKEGRKNVTKKINVHGLTIVDNDLSSDNEKPEIWFYFERSQIEKFNQGRAKENHVSFVYFIPERFCPRLVKVVDNVLDFSFTDDVFFEYAK